MQYKSKAYHSQHINKGVLYVINFLNFVKLFFIKSTKKATQNRKIKAPLSIKKQRSPRRRVKFSIKTLLDNLEKTHSIMGKLIKKDKHAFKLSRGLGIYVNSDIYEDVREPCLKKLELFQAEGLPPEMLCSSHDFSPDTDEVPALLWANKVRYIPGTIKRENEVNYFFGQVGIFEGDIFNTEYWVAVNKLTGEVRPQPRARDVKKIIGNKRGKSIHITTRSWEYPPVLLKSGWTKGPSENKKAATKLFHAIYNVHSLRSMGITVRACKDDINLVFTIPEHEWKDFFSDRIYATSANGRKKRIFHWVSAHTRDTKGKISNVRTHTRGIRHFSWKGFDITISIAGLHGRGLNAFDLTPFDEADPQLADMKSDNITELTNEHIKQIREISV